MHQHQSQSQQQWQGGERRQPQSQYQYQGDERRHGGGSPGLSLQERKDEQQARAQQQEKDHNPH
jgi:hypothetical protein